MKSLVLLQATGGDCLDDAQELRADEELAKLLGVVLRQRLAAGVSVLACLVMPTVDALTAMSEGGTSLAMALAVHGSAAADGVVLAFALLRRRPA